MTIPYRVTFTDGTADLAGKASDIAEINNAIPDEAHIDMVTWGRERMGPSTFIERVYTWRQLKGPKTLAGDSPASATPAT